MAEHIVSRGLYLRIFAALVVLALATTGVAYVDLGPFGIAVALLIAFTKMVLVILYFMHVRWASPLTRVFVVAAFAWLAILIGLSLTDYLSRYWLPAPGKAPGVAQGPL